MRKIYLHKKFDSFRQGNDPYDSGKYNDKKYVVQYTTTFKPEKDIQTRVLLL